MVQKMLCCCLRMYVCRECVFYSVAITGATPGIDQTAVLMSGCFLVNQFESKQIVNDRIKLTVIDLSVVISAPNDSYQLLRVSTGIIPIHLEKFVELPSPHVFQDQFLVFGNEVMWQGNLDKKNVLIKSPFLSVCPLANSGMAKLTAELFNLFV